MAEMWDGCFMQLGTGTQVEGIRKEKEARRMWQRDKKDMMLLALV